MEIRRFAAMASGIMVFAVTCTVVSGLAPVRKFASQSTARRVLRIGFITRVAILPLGWYTDMLPGMLAVAIVGEWLGSFASESFGFVFVTTLVQGVLLNVVLAIYMLIVLAIITFPWGHDPSSPSHRRRRAASGETR